MTELDAVLPLLPKDLDRCSILARSLERNCAGLGTLFVVVPDRFLGAMKNDAKKAMGTLPIEVVSESHLVSEMSRFRHLPGWYKQQLIKLAAAKVVASEFYLTLDADVVATRPMSADDLVPGGKSACFVIAEDLHPDWYEGAEAVLGLTAKRRGVLHNVTPVVWSKHAVCELTAHLDAVARARRFAGGFRGLRQRVLWPAYRPARSGEAEPWQAWLAASSPWAEYATYFTFLEATGRFERYHFESTYCIYDIGRSVWWKDDFATWDPAPLFEGKGPPYFAVIQSNTHIPVATIWDKLAPWLGEAPRARAL